MYYKVDFQPDTVVFHGDCVDGFSSAYVVWKKFQEQSEQGEIRFIPGSYALNRDDESYWINLVQNKKVVVLDFSFGRDLMISMHHAAEELIVLDHHKTAEEEIGDLDFCHFRQDMSGALITWHAFNKEKEILFKGIRPIFSKVPNLIKYVSDRDLWTWKLKHSKKISAYISFQKRTFDNWNILCSYLEKTKIDKVADYGDCVLQHINFLVGSIASKAEIWKINGVKVIAVNSSELQSEICHKLLKCDESEGVSGCYRIEKGKMTWSLRSTGESDVALIAQSFEGGGHKKAAGFTLSLAEDNNQVMFGVRCVNSG